jgi:phospholipase C
VNARVRHLVSAAVVTAALVGAVCTPLASAAAGGHAPRTPIRHFIYLMQENHTFDNYFGTYPGADGIPSNVCMPINISDPKTKCIRPFHLGNSPIRDLGHNTGVFRAQYRDGQMNGFINAFRVQGLNGTEVMGHYDGSDIPFYWNVADTNVLFDHFFSAAAAGSVWNHMYWVAGAPGNPKEDSIPPGGFKSLPTIFDRLEKAGVTWKFYVQNYDPRITYRTRIHTDKGSQIVWVPLLDYARYIDNPKLFSHIVDMDQYYKDVADGNLPQVSYMVPSGSSEHPPGSIQAGERFVRTIMNALISSRYWTSSAFMWTYDDWGGWYDHVMPPQRDKYGDGFRVPGLLVSAYAKKGFIDHTPLDFTSALKFIEYNWNVKPLASRDAKANNILSAFDFNQAPRSPQIIPAVRGIKPPAAPNRSIIYPAYTLAFVLTGMLISWASGFWRPRKPHRPARMAVRVSRLGGSKDERREP